MKLILKIFIFFIATKALANPSGEKVVSGNIQIERINEILKIYQKSDNAIINWKDFSINENEITKIIASSDNAAILNRVISSNPSHLFGKLLSNANVFLINQNGILVGKNALIDTKALTLSTLDIANDEFLNAKDLRFKSDSIEKIINKGKIHTFGDIYLIARDVHNRNEITSEKGAAHLIGAMDVILIEKKTPQIGVGIKNQGSCSNKGTIKAVNVELKAAGNNIYALAINSKGVIETNGAIEKDGRVILAAEEGVVSINGKINSKDIQITGDHIHIKSEAKLDASTKMGKSRILIGGDYKGENPEIKNAKTTTIYEGAQIFADALSNNEAGKIIIYSEEQTIFEGFISAQGIKKDGGFVEISSKDRLNMSGEVLLNSISGKKGSLLLDPGSIRIVHGDAKNYGANVFTDGFIQEILKNANLEISTKNATNNEDQTITIDGKVNILWKDKTTLTFEATRNIIMKSGAKIENTSDEKFLAIHFKTINDQGNFTGIILEKDTQILSRAANIKLDGRSGNIGDNNYGILAQGKIMTQNDLGTAGNITLIGKANRGDNNNVGIYLKGAELSSKNGKISLSGQSFATKESNDGILLDNGARIILESANLVVDGKASGTNSTGVNLANSHIEARGLSSIDIIGKESGKVGIDISENARILSMGVVNLKATDSIHAHGQIVSQGKVKIDIGCEKDGRFVLKKTIYAKELEIHGNDNNDTFYMYAPQKCKIFGGKANNTLIAPDGINVYEITSLNSGILNRDISFAQIQNLKGSIYLDDTFVFSRNGKLNGKIDGGGGKNTIIGPNVDNIWTLTSSDTGYINGISNFQNIQNLVGGEKSDTFTFLTGASVSGIIDGKAGNNVIDYCSCMNDLTLDLHKVINVQEVIGGKQDNVLIGPEDINVWYISAHNKGEVGSIKFENFQNLVGSGIQDTFYALENAKIDGEINGAGGNNSLHAPNKTNSWHITGVNRGYIEDTLTFSNIQNLFGGEKQDTYKFLDYAYVTGSINGMSKMKNTLDFSSHTSEVAIDLNNLENIQEIIGGGKTTLIGRDVDNIWAITNDSSGSLNDHLTFVNIENIIGGSKKDIFAISKEGKILGYIDGKSGDSSIYAADKDNTWNIYAVNTGKLNDSLNFKNVKNLIGSDLTDKFYFENQGKIEGKIDGGKGINNVLDFSKKIDPITLDLNKIDNVNTVVGSKGLDTLIGRDKTNVWYFSALNEGYVQDINFIGFENIQGGNSSDIFVFKDNTGVTGFIDGGCDISMNILDYSLCTKPVQADLLSGETSNSLKSSNIQAAVLPKLSGINAKELAQSVEIPLYETDNLEGYFENSFVRLFKDSKFMGEKDRIIDEVNFPIYWAKGEYTGFVYRASSPFIITKKTSKSQFFKVTMSPFLADNRVADDSVRMKNNLYKPIFNEKIAVRGHLKQSSVEFEKEDSGFDLEDFTIITQNVKEKSIKQRPRPFHYNSK
ncbi:MAG: Heme/hemopexin-binding protein [Candidatus Anoxychlamydiales bacterium]|nr:Heme/hemopexin-binding protein [Candidatus Anoxychlamydiales bacterium]